MPVQYGTVIKFDSSKGWGFARIKYTNTCVLVHRNQKWQARWVGPAPHDIKLWLNPLIPKTSLVMPKEGDELALNTRQTNKGGRAVAWAYKWEWDEAGKTVRVPPPITLPIPPPALVSVAPIPPPRIEPQPLAFAEMLKAFDYRFLHALLDAMEKEGLTLTQVEEFVRSAPKGKKGDGLWNQYLKRKAHSRKKNYGVAAFIREILEEVGFVVEI